MTSHSQEYVGIPIHEVPLTGTESGRPPRPAAGPRHFMKQVSRMSFKEGMKTAGKTMAKMTRMQSTAQQGLKGLRFLDKTSNGKDGWKSVEKRFDDMAVHGRLAKEKFGKCIGEIFHKQLFSFFLFFVCFCVLFFFYFCLFSFFFWSGWAFSTSLFGVSYFFCSFMLVLMHLM